MLPAGGGSGYLKFVSQKVDNVTHLENIIVGGPKQSSHLIINNVTLEAQRGNGSFDIGGIGGGDGYSGGGAVGSFNGGTNGGDGKSNKRDGVLRTNFFQYQGEGEGRQGRGSGFDISLELSSITSFILTPGVGGQYAIKPGKDSDFAGGGGGGVMVDGRGPERASVTQGQGYGGGCFYDTNMTRLNEALPGIILMELSP